MIERFQEWYENRHEYARHWKENHPNGKVMGYLCTYVPEEILYAADILPVRILGSHEPQNVTEPYIFGMYCPFCRDCLAQGLQGRYDYLDGIMIAQSCVHIRHTFVNWDASSPMGYKYFLPMPQHVQSRRALPFLVEEYKGFIESLEKWTGKKIRTEDLTHGIEVMNRNRHLMRQVYEIRKNENPRMTGLEAMHMVVSSQLIDKREHNQVLEEVLEILPQREWDHPPGNRLMILGSEDDDTEFVKMVESLGATFVIDDHCTGSRYFWNSVSLNADPLTSIAKRYIARPACPSKDWPEQKRLHHVRTLAKEWNVGGAIILQQKFCDPHELDIPGQRKNLEDSGIPSLHLELDVTVPVGQFRIRTEAFLEMLRQDELF